MAEPLADASRRLRSRVGALQGGMNADERNVRVVARPIVLRAFPLLPIAFVAAFLLAPLGLTIAVSFWQRVGLSRPARLCLHLLH